LQAAEISAIRAIGREFEETRRQASEVLASSGPVAISIEVSGDIVALAERISSKVKSGNAKLVATETTQVRKGRN
jgi:hypothetical protein